MPAFRKKLVVAGCCALAALGAAGFVFRNLALWLVVADPLPASLDAIFTFAGETHRIIYSKELFAQYKQSRWLISYPSKKIAVPLGKGGLDTARITVVDTCKNTHSEAAFITQWAASAAAGNAACSPAHPLAVGLVSTPFHMRRIRTEIRKRASCSACRFFYLPVPFERYGVTRQVYQNWWLSKPLRQAVILEFEKYLYYLFI
jgi:uncharacterized SAM-binding protein YcdF (DUF218 family)